MDNNVQVATTENTERTSNISEFTIAEVQDNNDDYYPDAARSLTHGNTDFAVFMHLLKASIGSGILFLPHAFRRAGYVSALVCSFFIGLITCHTAVLTVQCSQILCKRSHKTSMDLAETVFTSFQHGPKRIRKYAVHVNVVTNIFVCFIQYETTIIYALYVATSAKQIIEHFTEVNLDVRIYVIMFLPIYWGLSLVSNFKQLVPFSVLGAMLLVLGLSFTLYYLVENIPSPERLDLYTNIISLPIYCNIFLFAVHNMTMIMPLENTMKNPKNMTRLLATSMFINMFMYMGFGFLGYNKYYDACDTVIKNLPIDHITAQLVKIAVTLSVVCTYGLHYYIPVNILWPMIVKRIHRHHHRYEILFRLGGVTVSTLFAIAVPQMASVLGFLTALSMTTMALFIPVVIDIMTKWYDDHDNLTSFYCRWIKNIFIGLVWLFMLVFGVSENLQDIVKNFNVIKSNSSIC